MTICITSFDDSGGFFFGMELGVFTEHYFVVRDLFRFVGRLIADTQTSLWMLLFHL